ncbi:hypothetical protein [Streptomyces canus]|uniref:hypothetical protein n=1 Tax=Streptomyces canus TaxID=58343 RepID=UPI002F91A960
MHASINLNQLATSGCTQPIVVLTIGAVLITGGIIGAASAGRDPAGGLGCIPMIIGAGLIIWVLQDGVCSTL